jgi:hypothetical protein
VVPDSVARLLERVPMRWVRLIGAVALTGLGICSLESADRGTPGRRRPWATWAGRADAGLPTQSVIHFPTGRLRMTMTDRDE